MCCICIEVCTKKHIYIYTYIYASKGMVGTRELGTVGATISTAGVEEKLRAVLSQGDEETS